MATFPWLCLLSVLIPPHPGNLPLVLSTVSSRVTSPWQPSPGYVHCQFIRQHHPGHFPLVISTGSFKAISPLKPSSGSVHCQLKGHLTIVTFHLFCPCLVLRPPHPRNLPLLMSTVIYKATSLWEPSPGSVHYQF